MNIPILSRPVVDDSWCFNLFLDTQARFLTASGAGNWLIDHLMMDTIVRMRRLGGRLANRKGKL